MRQEARATTRFILIFLLFLRPALLHAVEKYAITGIVTDATTGEPLVGANVTLVSTTLGAATDVKGRFVIEDIPAGSYTVAASYIGFETARQAIQMPAAQNSELVFQLLAGFFQTEQVVVTATRTQRLMEDVPVVTELINKQDIQETGAEDLADILDDRPGIFISENDVGGKNIRMGGVDGKYILVLVDGVPLTGKFNNRQELNLIDADLIERVEIVKGPSSAIYGSEAMGGVINIITKNIRHEFAADFKGKTGSYGLYSANARLSTSIDSLGLALNLDHAQGGVDPGITSLNVRNAESTQISAEADYHSPALGAFEATVTRQGEDQVGQDPLFRFETDLLRQDVRMSWRRSFGKKLGANIRAYGSEYERDYHEIVQRSGFVRTENYSVETIRGLKSDFSYAFDDKNRLDAGFDLSFDRYDSRRESVAEPEPASLAAKRDLYGFFAQTELAPVPKLTLLIGGRFDRMSDVPSHFSPRFSGMYSFTPLFKMRASYGGGFRAPSFNDMYIDFNHTSFGYRVIGNPDLVPEKSRGFSAGIEWFWNYQILTNVTVYRNYFTDMIVDYPVDPVYQPGTLSYKNIDKATINTFEVQSKFYLSKNLTAQFAYNYTAIGEQEAREEVINMPPLSASLKINWKFWRALEMSLRDQWFGQHDVREFEPLIGDYVDRLITKKAYHLMDATVTYWPGKHLGRAASRQFSNTLYNMFALRTGVTNMADYTDLRYGPWLGRRFFLTLEINY